MGRLGSAPGSDVDWLGGNWGGPGVSGSRFAGPCRGEAREGYASLEIQRDGQDIGLRTELPIDPPRPQTTAGAERHLIHRRLGMVSRPVVRLAGYFLTHSGWKREMKDHARTGSHRPPDSYP